MTEAVLFLGLLVLGVVAYQLRGIRLILERGAETFAVVRQERELDDEIHDACPTLFYPFKGELRAYFRIFRKKRAYYEKHKRWGDMMSPHSDEEASWYDIYSRLFKAGNEQQKVSLHAMAVVTDSFLKTGSESLLRPAEMSFFAFQAWRELLNDGGDAEVLGMIAGHLERCLAEHTSTYKRPPGREEAG